MKHKLNNKKKLFKIKKIFIKKLDFLLIYMDNKKN